MIAKAAIPEFHALLVRDLWDPYFDPYWHFHPEYQIFVVLEGAGIRFIGDQVERFGPGDLTLIGPNLPHVWRSDDVYFEKDSDLMTHGIVVYFREVVLDDKLLSTEEGLKIRQLFKRSEQGLAFFGETQKEATRALKDLTEASGFDYILGLLKILHILSLSDECEVLSRLSLANPVKPADQQRMSEVYDFLMEHFTEQISLDEIAAVANMAPTAFCRYFKNHTNKTLWEFITELRIGYACKLLVAKDLSITQVAHESGYPTLSNFNQQFKSLSNLTPSEYRDKYAAVMVNEHVAG